MSSPNPPLQPPPLPNKADPIPINTNNHKNANITSNNSTADPNQNNSKPPIADIKNNDNNNTTIAATVLDSKNDPTSKNLKTAPPSFAWESIGNWKLSNSRTLSPEQVLAQTNEIQNYFIQTFFSDYYWNTILMIGTCFFSWLTARIGLGIFSLVFVLLATASVYKAEFRRFNRNTKDDMLRSHVADRLETEIETMEWLNEFLAKMWVIYMDTISEQVLLNVNPILAGSAPGFGIDSLSLNKFNLGTKSPKVNGIKSYTKLGDDTVEMDWAFSFTPTDTLDMTAEEVRNQIKPKVELAVGVGKGLISKKMPILVENMSFKGRMKFTIKLGSNSIPFIKMIYVSFLEPPVLDYSLKPVGGDTFGLDIMSFIPGLKKAINAIVHGVLKGYFYAPNRFPVDVEAIMAAVPNDAIGCLVLTLQDAHLKDGKAVYMQIFPENAKEEKKIRTENKTGPSPRWNKTYYILTNTLNQKLLFNVYNHINLARDKSLGTAEFDLQELLQDDSMDHLSIDVESNGKKKGSITFSVAWYPELKAEKPKKKQPDEPVDYSKMVDEEGNFEVDNSVPESEVGILKFSVFQAKELDVSSSIVGQLSPYAILYFDKKKVFQTWPLKRANEPSWGHTEEWLVDSRSTTKVKLVIKNQTDFVDDPIVATFKGTLQQILTQIDEGSNDWFKLSPQGYVRFGAHWKPIGLTSISTTIKHQQPIGAFRIHIRNCEKLKNPEKIGKPDPYVLVKSNGKIKYRTVAQPETLKPSFEEVVYISVVNENQLIEFDVMDVESLGRDHPLGKVTFTANTWLQKGPYGTYLGYDGSDKINKSPLFIKKKSKGFIYYSVSFIPFIPVYGPIEIKKLKEEEMLKKEEEAKELEIQKELEELMKNNPNEYEIIEVEDVSEEISTEKIRMDFSELVSHNSGMLVIFLKECSIGKSNLYLSVLFDEIASPAFISGPSKKGIFQIDIGEGFVRDLQHSNIVFRLATSYNVDDESEIVAEQSYPTLKLLESGYENPIPVSIGNHKVDFQFEYVPSKTQLSASESILDTGRVKIEILNGEDLLSADRNGKSDPYAVLKFNGIKVYKTEVKKKTLDPVWNEEIHFPLISRSRTRIILEAYDWDLAGDDDELGFCSVDLQQIEPYQTTPLTLPLTLNGKQKGIINIRATFLPEYIRQKLDRSGGGLPIDLGDVAGAPIKLVTGVAGVAAGGVGKVADGVGKVG
ncbi:Tcb3p ASCRUDRAFT_29922, partial [Ascoidea rubescens DSM 1968]